MEYMEIATMNYQMLLYVPVSILHWEAQEHVILSKHFSLIISTFLHINLYTRTFTVKKKTTGPSVLGKMWQDIVLAFIGEQFAEPDVVGISVCIRKSEDLISVWNTDNRNENIRFGIGEKMKEVLDLEPSTVIEYKAHAESMQDLSTFRNTKAYVFAAAGSSA